MKKPLGVAHRQVCNLYLNREDSTRGVVADKYRGTVQYHQVFTELVTAARYRGTVPYQHLGQHMKLPLVGAYRGAEIGHILGGVSEDEHNT
jgi:hypothetical protein